MFQISFLLFVFDCLVNSFLPLFLCFPKYGTWAIKGALSSSSLSLLSFSCRPNVCVLILTKKSNQSNKQSLGQLDFDLSKEKGVCFCRSASHPLMHAECLRQLVVKRNSLSWPCKRPYAKEKSHGGDVNISLGKWWKIH